MYYKDIPNTYDELSSDKLELLLYYNQYLFRYATDTQSKQILLQKIEYISQLLNSNNK